VIINWINKLKGKNEPAIYINARKEEKNIWCRYDVCKSILDAAKEGIEVKIITEDKNAIPIPLDEFVVDLSEDIRPNELLAFFISSYKGRIFPHANTMFFNDSGEALPGYNQTAAARLRFSYGIARGLIKKFKDS
jgi:hypothetical protein